MTKQLLQQALDALEYGLSNMGVGQRSKACSAIEALRVAIAAPEPEPVGYTDEDGLKYVDAHFVKVAKCFPPGEWIAVYTAPPDAEFLREELEEVKAEFTEVANFTEMHKHGQAMLKADWIIKEWKSRIECRDAEIEELEAQMDAMALDAARFDFMEREAKKEGMIPVDGDLRKQVDAAMAAKGNSNATS